MHKMDNSNEEIAALRIKIDAIDGEIVRLLNDRAKIAQTVGDIKNTAGRKVYEPARENDILDKVNDQNEGPLSKGAIEDVFRSIIDVCRQIQVKD